MHKKARGIVWVLLVGIWLVMPACQDTPRVFLWAGDFCSTDQDCPQGLRCKDTVCRTTSAGTVEFLPRPDGGPVERAPSEPSVVPDRQVADQVRSFCGDGACDPSKENCRNCNKDCPCIAGESCNQRDLCEPHCGNGLCDPTLGENCANCSGDCACPGSEVCQGERCVPSCGDGRCLGSENCSTCPKDCKCPAGDTCTAGNCGQKCGDGNCDESIGENCGTCVKDCPCDGGKTCVEGACGCQPQCNGKACGDDGCGGSCGTCPENKTCDNGACVCNHLCNLGESKCLDAGTNQVCKEDASGCRIWLVEPCPSTVCTSGSCCVPNCAGKGCGVDDGCGAQCSNGCSSCSSCRFGCVDGKCKLRVTVTSYELPCQNCKDRNSGKPDVFLYLVLGQYRTYSTPMLDRCNKQSPFGWVFDSEVFHNGAAKVELRDLDRSGSELCAQGSIDFSQYIGKTHTANLDRGAKLTFRVEQ